VSFATSGPPGRETVIGVLGGRRGAAVDACGLVAPRALAWELDWWIGAEDRWRLPAREAAVRQQLIDGMPVVQTAMRVPGGDAVQRAYGAPVGDVGEVAVVEIANESPAPFVAALVVRGAGALDLADSTVFVDGRSAVRTPRAPSRWAMAADGTIEQLVTERGGATAAPFGARRDRGARLVAAFLFPVAHRTTLRAAVAIGTRGLGGTEPGALPDAAAVARGWAAQLDRGMQVELPDESLQRAVQTARAATVLAGQAWKVDPAVVGVLEDWGLDPEAASAWTRLTGRERRRLGRRSTPPDASWAEVRAQAAGTGPDLLRAVRAVLVRESDDAVTLMSDWPSEWTGQPVDVRAAPTRRGPMSYSIRWHGTRPALLWDGPAATRITAPGLDGTWSTTEARGEALLAGPSARP
jgi:hypothetical protein